MVAALSVEGVSKSSIARVKGLAWNTVDRWLERAAACCRQFNDQTITGVDMPELQADEIRTVAGGKDEPSWIFSTIDVWSRLWPSAVVGRRSYRNTRTGVPRSSRRSSSATCTSVSGGSRRWGRGRRVRQEGAV